MVRALTHTNAEEDINRDLATSVSILLNYKVRKEEGVTGLVAADCVVEYFAICFLPAAAWLAAGNWSTRQLRGRPKEARQRTRPVPSNLQAAM